jgi:hypothetical protein
MITSAQQSISRRRDALGIFLQASLTELASVCVDETIYLRTASLNIHNGLVGLTFFCHGSHSIYADEFREKGLEFWIARAAAGATTKEF